MARVHHESPSELLEMLEEAMFSIEQAMEAMKGFAEFEDWYLTLSTIRDEMEPKHEELDRAAAGEYHEEMQRLARDYYRSVL